MFDLRILKCQISIRQTIFVNLERSFCLMNYTTTPKQIITLKSQAFFANRATVIAHTHTPLIEYDLTRLFQPLLVNPKKTRREALRYVWLPKTWFGQTDSGNTGRQNRHFWWPYRKGTSPNESHIHIFAASSKVEKRNTLTLVGSIQA